MLKVFYCCYGSAHSSVIAAAIHLGWLPWDRVPSIQEVIGQPRFDRTPNREIGIPFPMGRDSGGNEVYVLGLGPERALIRRSIYSLLSLWNYPAGDILLVDTLAAIHPMTRLGGYLSRRLGLVRMGRPLAAIGIRWSYPRLVQVVKKTMAQVTVLVPLDDQLDG